MKKILFHYFLAAVLLTSISCRKNNVLTPATPATPDTSANGDKLASGKYTNGFFILNSGLDSSYHDVAFYSYDTDSLLLSGYRKENVKPNPLNVADLKFGTIYKDKLYLILKGKGPLVIVNPSTLKEIARINNVATLDPHVFLGINENEGLLSCHKGIYRVSLSNPRFIGQLPGPYILNYPVTEMVRSGDYIFALTGSGAVILNVKDYGIVKLVKGFYAGFTVSKDGSVWGIGVGPMPNRNEFLLRINPVTLVADTITTPYAGINYNYFGSYRFNSCLAASTQDNMIYMLSGRGLYRVTIGKSKPQFARLFVIGNRSSYMGNMVNYNAAKNQLVVLTSDANGAPGGSKNVIYILDAKSGAVQKTFVYKDAYEPIMAVFH